MLQDKKIKSFSGISAMIEPLIIALSSKFGFYTNKEDRNNEFLAVAPELTVYAS